jgi:hypothetical protein
MKKLLGILVLSSLLTFNSYSWFKYRENPCCVREVSCSTPVTVVESCCPTVVEECISC